MIAVTIWPLAPNAAEAEYPDLDLNQGLDLRRVQCYPLHHRDISHLDDVYHRSAISIEMDVTSHVNIRAEKASRPGVEPRLADS